MNRQFTPVRSQYHVKVMGKVREQSYPTPKDAEMAAAWICRKENISERFVQVVVKN
jgi:hypothetical protein